MLGLQNRWVRDNAGWETTLRPLRRRRLAAITGWPTLPEPPAPGGIIGPDHRRHFIRYRVLRMPGALVALAEELGGLAGSRYKVELHGGHFADPGPAAARHQAEMRPPSPTPTPN